MIVPDSGLERQALFASTSLLRRHFNQFHEHIGGNGRDWFGTFHGAKRSDWNGGTINAVFVDAHVDKVRSALRTTEDNQADTSEAESGGFEEYGWPHRTPFR